MFLTGSFCVFDPCLKKTPVLFYVVLFRLYDNVLQPASSQVDRNHSCSHSSWRHESRDTDWKTLQMVLKNNDLWITLYRNPIWSAPPHALLGKSVTSVIFFFFVHIQRLNLACRKTPAVPTQWCTVEERQKPLVWHPYVVIILPSAAPSSFGLITFCTLFSICFIPSVLAALPCLPPTRYSLPSSHH